MALHMNMNFIIFTGEQQSVGKHALAKAHQWMENCSHRGVFYKYGENCRSEQQQSFAVVLGDFGT